MTRSTPKLSEAARRLVIPSGIVTSDWPKVRELAARLCDIRYDRWQDGLGMVMLGKRADGIYAATVGGIIISICRQAGKTFLIGTMIFMLSILNPGLTILWTAHRSRTSDETFQFMKGLASRASLRRYIYGVRSANGQQEISVANGSRIMFGARERGFGRGFDAVDIEIFDEAQILSENAMDDMVPAMNVSPNGLVILLGTPPKPSDPSEVFSTRRGDAINGTSDDKIYVEFSADKDADIDDRSQWEKANPSYPNRTPASSILRLQNLLGDDSFRREGLGIWNEQISISAISREQWEKTVVGTPNLDGLIGYGIDMPPNRSSLAIGGAIKHKDGTAHIELRKFESTQSQGTMWAVEWIVEHWPRTASVVIDGQSPAAALIPDLKARHVKVITTTATDMGRATGRFQDMLRDHQLTHMPDDAQPALATAVHNATTRNIGTSGAQGWNKMGSDIDISPLVAVTLALFGVYVTKRDPNRKQKVMV